MLRAHTSRRFYEINKYERNTLTICLSSIISGFLPFLFVTIWRTCGQSNSLSNRLEDVYYMQTKENTNRGGGAQPSLLYTELFFLITIVDVCQCKWPHIKTSPSRRRICRLQRLTVHCTHCNVYKYIIIMYIHNLSTHVRPHKRTHTHTVCIG